MKKIYLMSLAALLTASCFTSCKEENGTEPGNDAKALATVYTYDAELPYNADNDCVVRCVGNSKTEAMYVYSTDKASYDEAMQAGEAAYIETVISKGTQMTFAEESPAGTVTADTVLTDMVGEYIISVVAVGGGQKTLTNSTFVGLEWKDITDGYLITKNNFVKGLYGDSYLYSMLQECTTEGKEGIWRLKDLYGKGYSLKLTSMGDDYLYDTDYGPLQYVRVAAQPTGLVHPSYGAVGVRDIATWQGNDSFASNANYCSYIYLEDGYTVVGVQYYVSAGNAGYGQEVFYPMSYFEEGKAENPYLMAR